MAPRSIIEISMLACSYSLRDDQTVLFVENLSLPAGKIIFLLGASGSGKSTLLETLGLMNNTIASGQVRMFVDSDNVCEFSQLWKDQDLERISSIRKNHLSFIFQNTNLMENFSAYENICLSQMIKTEGTQDKAMDGAVKLMNQVGLPLDSVGADTLSVYLSGGQRQRISFVRALNNDFRLLLCDEPTGNLDEINAHELVNIVRKNIGDDKTAIIVSHDINLALKFADQIILITKNKEKGYGEILSENIFHRHSWDSLGQADSDSFRKSLAGNFVTDAKVEGEAHSDKPIAIEKQVSYRTLFRKKEGKTLFGKNYLNLSILVTILSITFIALGFANGALTYLDRKYNDPFVRLLSIGIPWAKSSSSTVEGLTDKLNTRENRERFLIDTVTAYKETPLPVFNTNTGKSEYIKGRLISIKDPINTYLFNDLNWISGGKSFLSETDLGMVVTQKLLERLGYPIDAKVIYIDNGDIDTLQKPAVKYRVPVPVRAVVRDIPGRNNYLITNFFYSSFVNRENCVFDFKEQSQRILFFVEGDKEFAKSLGTEIKKLVDANSITEEVPVSIEQKAKSNQEAKELDFIFGGSLEDFESEDIVSDSKESVGIDSLKFETRSYEVDVRWEDTCDYINVPGYQVSVNLSAKPYSYGTTEKIYREIVKSEYFSKNKGKIIRIFDYLKAPFLEDKSASDFLCVVFSSNGLDSIGSFSNYVFNELNDKQTKEQANVIDVDAGAVQEKNNFNYISKMTWLISGLLIAFSILSICLFISNLLKTHLNKVKMNIGTFKAFGLSDSESINIYLGIMSRFILSGIVLSLLIAFALGSLFGFWFKGWLNIDDQVDYFSLLDAKTFILIGVVIGVSAITSYFSITRILSKTPGDLIYNR